MGDAARAISASLSRTLGWTTSGEKGGGGGGGELVEAARALGFQRLPFFCAGCPHNTGTTIPDGAHAIGGIGCHTLGTFMGDRGIETFTHMGCEGSNWIGQAPFVETRHAFANMGDGTYVHSGLLSIRACVASGANMTFKVKAQYLEAPYLNPKHDFRAQYLNPKHDFQGEAQYFATRWCEMRH